MIKSTKEESKKNKRYDPYSTIGSNIGQRGKNDDLTFDATSSTSSWAETSNNFGKGISEENLWTYLIGLHKRMQDHEVKIDSIFKSKSPKKYIQVKTSVINSGT